MGSDGFGWLAPLGVLVLCISNHRATLGRDGTHERYGSGVQAQVMFLSASEQAVHPWDDD